MDAVIDIAHEISGLDYADSGEEKFILLIGYNKDFREKHYYEAERNGVFRSPRSNRITMCISPAMIKSAYNSNRTHETIRDIGCLLAHEYGHVISHAYFGMKTGPNVWGHSSFEEGWAYTLSFLLADYINTPNPNYESINRTQYDNFINFIAYELKYRLKSGYAGPGCVNLWNPTTEIVGYREFGLAVIYYIYDNYGIDNVHSILTSANKNSSSSSARNDVYGMVESILGEGWDESFTEWFEENCNKMFYISES